MRAFLEKLLETIDQKKDAGIYGKIRSVLKVIGTKEKSNREELFKTINFNFFNDIFSFHLEQPGVEKELKECLVFPQIGRDKSTSLWDYITTGTDLLKQLQGYQQLDESIATLMTELLRRSGEETFAMLVVKEYEDKKEFRVANQLPIELWETMSGKAELGVLDQIVFTKHNGKGHKSGHYVSITPKKLSVKKK